MFNRLTKFFTTSSDQDEAPAPYKLRVVHFTDDGNTRESEEVELSHPSPVFSDVQASIVQGSLRPSQNMLEILGNVEISGKLEDRASGLIPGQDGAIYFICARIGGQVTNLHQIRLNVTKLESSASGSEPYPFSGSFQYVLQQIVLRPGWNNIDLFATNAHGISGGAEIAFSVDAEGPDAKTVTDYSKFTFKPGKKEAPTITGGGDFNPFCLRIEGPSDSLQQLSEVHLHGRSYYPLSFKGGRYLTSVGKAIPTVFLAVAFPDRDLGNALPPRDGEWDFTAGFGGDLLKTAVPILDGRSIVGEAVWPSVQDQLGHAIVCGAQTSGSHTVIESRGQFAASWKTISQLSAIVKGILDDHDDVVYPVILGDVPELRRLSVEFSDAFSSNHEIMQEYYAHARNLTQNEVGRLMGFAIHEAIRYISTRGPAGVLLQEIMKAVITNLKDHPSYSI